MLKKGDPCYVRLFNGKIVEAVYDVSGPTKKAHWVVLQNGKYALARPHPTPDTSFGIPDCRFVCMTGIKGKDDEHV